jgi:hypothetical protein
MREELLHFIWRFRYFNQHELFTEAGEALQIISPGELNVDQGPDFRNARVRIGGVLFQGPVELHVNASDWLRHAHDGDVHYRSVVLHVVWENDLPVPSAVGGLAMPAPPGGIPMLVLRHRTSKLLLGQYEKMMNSRGFIACERLLPQVPPSAWTEWRQQLSLDRLQQRALFIRDCLTENRQHWEETTWWLMARSLGQPVNSAAFEAIGRSLPVSLMVRHRSERVRLEALLLGQAGLLEGAHEEEYPKILQREYRFCRAKYGLAAASVPVSFLRMRPGHFPGVRLAQLAGLLSGDPGWFARIREADSPRDLESMLDIAATGYWEDHYVLGKRSAARPKRLGAAMKKGLLINAFIPILFAYGWLRGEPASRDKALRWLEETGPETNTVLTSWRRLGVTAPTAAASQALLELKKNYCDPKRCLDCAVGRVVLGRET